MSLGSILDRSVCMHKRVTIFEKFQKYDVFEYSEHTHIMHVLYMEKKSCRYHVQHTHVD